VDAAAEGVHDGVQVGGDVQSVQHDVVRGVADDGHLGRHGGGIQVREQAAQEPRTADSASQRHHPAWRNRRKRAGRPDARGWQKNTPRPGVSGRD